MRKMYQLLTFVLQTRAFSQAQRSEFHKFNLHLAEYQFGWQYSWYSRTEDTYLGILASAVPFLLPNPRCRPIRRAAVSSLARARECIVTCLRMISPSDINLRMVWRELALEISLTSFGSSQILRFPQPATEAARRF